MQYCFYHGCSLQGLRIGSWKQRVPITSKSSKFKGATHYYVVKLPKSAGVRHYCPKIQWVPGTLGTFANSSPASRCHFINFRFANARIANAYEEDSKIMNPPSYQSRPLYNPSQKLFKLKRTENNRKEDDVIDNVFRLRKRSSTASDNFGNVFRLKKRFLNYDS